MIGRVVPGGNGITLAQSTRPPVGRQAFVPSSALIGQVAWSSYTVLVSEKRDSRERLLDAAIEVIATKGESALRLIEVAEMAGLKQPTIHYMFPTREDLVVAALRERYRRAVLDVLETYDSLVAGATTRDEFVRASIRGLEFAMQDQRKAARATRLALFVKAETNAALLRELNDAAFEGNQRLAAVLGNAQRQGWIRDDVSPLTLAVWIRGQVLGRFVLEMDSERYDGEEWTRFAIAAIEATLLATSDPTSKRSTGKAARAQSRTSRR